MIFKVRTRYLRRPNPARCWVAEKIQKDCLERVYELPLEDPWEYAKRTGLIKPEKTEAQLFALRPKSRSVHYDIPHRADCPCLDCLQQTVSECGVRKQQTDFNHIPWNIVQRRHEAEDCPLSVAYDFDLDDMKWIDLLTINSFSMACNSQNPQDIFWDHLYDEWETISAMLSSRNRREIQSALVILEEHSPDLTVGEFQEEFSNIVKSLRDKRQLPRKSRCAIYFPDIKAVRPRKLVVDLYELEDLMVGYDVLQYHKHKINISCAQLWYLWCNRFNSQSAIKDIEWVRYQIAVKGRRPHKMLCPKRAKILELIVTFTMRYKERPQLVVDYLDFLAYINVGHITSVMRTEWIADNIDPIASHLMEASGISTMITGPVFLNFEQFDWNI